MKNVMKIVVTIGNNIEVENKINLWIKVIIIRLIKRRKSIKCNNLFRTIKVEIKVLIMEMNLKTRF